ncbi:hypothetical protein [Flavobacterium quisquiliarum]|uniref:DUF4424 domain-containing protein n=1 Tax=Flavobacterium quisquiliarum TaxID=1834436 RepID=A0ABV8W2F7_9FLAO|nr:hypothetical protein [Flavobacterium quisquiliarum]MBW1655447.1 hypothetical protein [Flavobacterium quisquiliarum]
MKKQNLIIVILLFFSGVYLHAQKNKDQTEKGMLFTLKYEHQDCSYEILVNDVPVVNFFGLGGGFSLKKEINQYILKPGKQDITIRIYPQKKTEDSFEDLISESAKVKIVIKKNKEPLSMLDVAEAREKGIQTEWDVLSFETPAIEKNVPYIEFKTSFNVLDKDITWKIKGWSESRDLRNDPDLRKQVDAFYENFKSILASKKQQEYLKLLKTSIHEEAESKPWFGADLEKDLSNEMLQYANEERNFIYPCENAEMKFYGNGKIVTLICKDSTTYGYSPLISKTAKNVMPKVHVFYLHKPKGSNELEIIR